MERISETDLHQIITLLNEETNANESQRYILSKAYGGFALHKLTGRNGGTSSVFGGHKPRKLLYVQIQAFRAGIEEGLRLSSHDSVFDWTNFELTQESLKQILSYEQSTDTFYWKIRPSFKIHSGSKAGLQKLDSRNGRGQIGINGKIYCVNKLARLYLTGKL